MVLKVFQIFVCERSSDTCKFFSAEYLFAFAISDVIFVLTVLYV